MPIRRMKRGECPSESSGRKTPIHHWIFPDICGVIERDELMPDHLRVNCQCYYGQKEQDEKIRSGQFLTLAERDRARSVHRSTTDSFCFSRRSFRHAVCQITRRRTTEILVCETPSNFLCPAPESEA